MKTAGVDDVRALANELRARGEELVGPAERVKVLCQRADSPAIRRELRRLCPGMRRVLVTLDGMFSDGSRGDDE
jgi:hypothetical protein